MSSSAIKIFGANGEASPYSSGSGKLASLGSFDPSTGRVYQRPRLRADGGITPGPHVRVTNPLASSLANERTAFAGNGWSWLRRALKALYQL